jgi:hypothetical protein
LACDGIYDVLENWELAQLVRSRLTITDDLKVQNLALKFKKIFLGRLQPSSGCLPVQGFARQYDHDFGGFRCGTKNERKRGGRGKEMAPKCGEEVAR